MLSIIYFLELYYYAMFIIEDILPALYLKKIVAPYLVFFKGIGLENYNIAADNFSKKVKSLIEK